ncbi:helix-turn-helix domain-containing protein [Saccharopolyspora sp. NPDC000359]|uniref:helix-turn-helix domain-containing protein n=1 Tax=Saccharopolyspora sp. NPDC000359 TaxID=3154251 RepID=UPI003333117F
MSKTGRPVFLTVRKAAWILSVDQSTISRAIRLGMLPTVQRNGRRVISANDVVRLLGEPINDAAQDGGRQ